MKLRYSIPLCFAVSICGALFFAWAGGGEPERGPRLFGTLLMGASLGLSLIHISEPTRPY